MNNTPTEKSKQKKLLHKETYAHALQYYNNNNYNILKFIKRIMENILWLQDV